MKNLLIRVMITAFAVIMLALTASAATDTDGYTLITTPEEFLAIADDLSGDYRLANNIDFTDVEYTVIGSMSEPFIGNLDGANYSVIGISIDAESESEDVYAAAFAYNKGTITDIAFDGALISADSPENVYVAAVAAVNEGVIEGISVTGATVTATSQYKAVRAAGITAYNLENGVVENSSAGASIEASATRLYADAAGIVAVNLGEVTSVYTYGEIDVTASSDALAGGIVSSNYGTVTDAENENTVKASSAKGYAMAGGICGRSESETTGCTNNGYAYVNGILVDATVRYGDVNSDGVVNVIDLIILARYNANWTGYDNTVVNVLAANVDGDAEVGTRDVTILARHIAAWAGYETLPWEG